MGTEDVYTLEPDTLPEYIPSESGEEGDPGYPVIVIGQPETPDPESWTLDDIQVLALGPVQSSTGLKGILLDILGPYDNIITQYRYQANTSSNYSYVHETTPDYPWIASAVLFVVLLYSVFQCFRRALWPK